ncbi:Histone H3.3B [Carabus blaptoides fortunei]
MSATTSSIGSVKKPYRYHPGTISLREIRRYKRSVELVLPAIVIQRLVAEIIEDKKSVRFQAAAMSALHEGHGILCLGVRRRADLTPKRKKLYSQSKKSERLLTALKRFNAAKSLFGKKQKLDVSGGSSVASNILPSTKTLNSTLSSMTVKAERCIFDGKRAKWSDIKQLYEFDGTADAEVTKLSNSHITPIGKEKMRVKFGAQRMAILLTLTNAGAMKARDTGEFIFSINDLIQ